MHQNEFDCCQFIQSIAKEPLKRVDVKVREMLMLKAHVQVCEPCIEILDKLALYAAPTNFGFYQSEPN